MEIWAKKMMLTITISTGSLIQDNNMRERNVKRRVSLVLFRDDMIKNIKRMYRKLNNKVQKGCEINDQY